jgi:hypothetical protein
VKAGLHQVRIALQRFLAPKLDANCSISGHRDEPGN